MKILFIITRGELGGGQRHVLDLLTGLKDRFDVELATGEEGFLPDSTAALGIPVHMLRHLVMPMNPLEDARGLAEIVALIRRIRPDLVHTHTSKAGILGRFAARFCGVPSIFTAHTWCFAEGTSWKWKAIGTPLEKLAGRFAGAIINVSDANRGLALERNVAEPDKLITIHNGVPDTHHRADPGDPAVPRIVMVARFAPQKAQAELIRAIHGIEQPLRVIFVGDGLARAAHEELAEKLGVRDRIDFLGVRPDIDRILATAHIFALPTNWEGFPLTILEAMRAGLPVVASDVGGVSEAVVEGGTGYLVRPGDTVGFGNRLRQLIADPLLRGRLGGAGRSRFETEFTAEAMVRKTIAVYQSVCSKAGSTVAHSDGGRSPVMSAPYRESKHRPALPTASPRVRERVQ